MYKSGLELSVILTTIFLLVNVTMVALALALIVKPFFATYEGNPTPAKKVEVNKGLWMPAMLLAIASVLAPLFGLGWINNNVVVPGVLSSSPDSAPASS